MVKNTGFTPPSQDRSKELFPWLRAAQLTRCQLFWIPLSAEPMRSAERVWLLRFLEEFTAKCSQEFGTQAETFLQLRSVLKHELTNHFSKHALELCPMPGLCRRPHEKLPVSPDREYATALQEGREQFDVGKFTAGMAYWFLADPSLVRRHYLGFGGMVSLLRVPESPPPPPIKIPKGIAKHPGFQKLFATFDPQQMQQRTQSMGDPFLAKSKLRFGQGLEDRPEYEGLMFIIPLLASGDFFSQAAAEVDDWFDVFTVYIGESSQDKGMLIAAKVDIEEMIIEIVREIEREWGPYPGTPPAGAQP